ncbi:MAG: hypothetical protein NVS1B5_05700 [Gemmatimonadaceae bacterium]
MEADSVDEALRFGPFDLDLGNCELRRDGIPVRLQPQPFRVLSLLARNAGRLVTRDEIRADIWGLGTFLDFDQSLNYCIRQIRSALDDDVSAPRYVETRQRLGYRFVGPVSALVPQPTDPVGSKITLVVLPFKNLSGEEKQDYFSDGLTEEMTTQLGRLNPEKLGVIARTSAMRYKDSTETVEQIGRQLRVNYLLEGSIRRAGNRVRIAAQLIQVSDQTHIWAENYERDLGDVLALQSDVARAVAREIQVKLGSKEQMRLAATRRIEPRALDAYLKGRYFWNKRSREALDKSIRYFESAIQEDARYAEAYAGLADCYLRMLDFSFMAPTDAFAKARAATDKALELDDTLPEAHTSLAHRSFHEFKWTIADHAFRCAIDLNPNYGIAHYYYSNFLAAMRRFDQAIHEAERALESDPVSAATSVNAAFVLYFAGRYDDAIDHGARALELDPGYTRTHYCLGLVYEQQGRFGIAIDAFRKALTRTVEGPGPRAALAHSYGLAGERRKALKLSKELERIAAMTYVSPFDFVLASLALGENDRAMRCLTRAYEARSSYMPFAMADPRLAPLHSHPRFGDLMCCMAFPG